MVVSFRLVYSWLMDLINPKQRWLIRKIPRHWKDKSELIPDLLFSMVIHFVEKEDGLVVLRYQIDSPGIDGEIDPRRVEEYSKAESDIHAAYIWALARDRMYATAVTMEQECVCNNFDTTHMQSIVRHYRHFWT